MNIEIVAPSLRDAYVAVMDSGLGGLSVVREMTALMPGERLIYFADNLHMPYGPRPLQEVRGFVVDITQHLLALPAKIVVLACNTASAAALKHLRELFPDTPFVGMEPAVKPAAASSKTGVVGVLATQATFQGELFESVVERFATDVRVIRMPCPGLAESIEKNGPDHPELEPLLSRFIEPLTREGADTIVLACTHYPLVKTTIERVAGPGVRIIDPSPAIAKRTQAVLRDYDRLRNDNNQDLRGGSEEIGTGGEMPRIYASGERERFSQSASVILGKEVRAESPPFLWLPS